MPTQPISLYAQLAELDAAFFQRAVNASHVSVIGAVAQTLAETAPLSLEAAQAATAPLESDLIAKLAPDIQPLAAVIVPAAIESATLHLYNWLTGAVGGEAAKQAAVATEQAAAAQSAPNGQATGG